MIGHRVKVGVRLATALAAGVAVGALAGPAAAQSVRGVTKNEIVIGMHTDLSGPAQFYGISSRNAIQMRVDEVNAAGGIHGRKIKLVVEDSQYQVPRAVQAANKLLNRDRIFLMVGAIGTPMNNAVMADQLAAGVPNMFPLTAARSMYEPFHKLKFSGGFSYYDQIRAGLKWMIDNKKKNVICTLYEDTDFGQEIFEGTRDQLKAMNRTLVESVTVKPTDSEFTAQITRLRNANCDLVTMGTIIKTTILPVATARKLGWNSVDFLGQSASYDYPVAAAPGGATEGFYSMASVALPYPDTATPQVQDWMKRYKEKFNRDINAGAIYGYNFMDMVVVGLDRAGKNLTTDSFVKGMESIQGYRDIFGGPVASLGPNKRKATDDAFLHQVQKGRWVPITGAITYQAGS